MKDLFNNMERGGGVGNEKNKEYQFPFFVDYNGEKYAAVWKIKAKNKSDAKDKFVEKRGRILKWDELLLVDTSKKQWSYKEISSSPFNNDDEFLDLLEEVVDRDIDEGNLTAFSKGGGVKEEHPNKRFGMPTKIKDTYSNFSVDGLWNAWNKKQREHFLNDHRTDIAEFHGKPNTVLNPEKWATSNFDDLPSAIKRAIGLHGAEGQYSNGGGVGKNKILKLYQKNHFSDSDSELIKKAIDNFEIETDKIKEDFMDYAYGRLEKEFGDKYSNEEIWSYTDENYENLLTHSENYKNLVDFLKEKYSNGGGIRSSNKDSRSLVQSRTPFNANNLSGEIVGDVYVVKSYGYYPVFVYKKGKWYENEDKYSKSTAKQMGQARPTGDVEKVSTDKLKAMYGFEDGGEFEAASELRSLENTIENHLVNGQNISVEMLSMYLGRKPNYEENVVGVTVRKCFLQPYFKKIK